MSNRQPSCSGSADMRPETEHFTRWLLLVLTPRCWESDFYFTVRDVAHVKNLSSWLNIQSFCKVRNYILACNLSPLEHFSHYWKRLCWKQGKPSLVTPLLTKWKSPMPWVGLGWKRKNKLHQHAEECVAHGLVNDGI